MMPLAMADTGEVNTIRKVSGNEETRRFLENLGFVIRSEVTVLSAIGGNVIVNIKDSRIAINADMARHDLAEADRNIRFTVRCMIDFQFKGKET